MLKLILNDDSEYCMELLDNPVADYVNKSCKHLQSIPIPFFPEFDYLISSINNQAHLINILVTAADKLNINVDISKLKSQEYLNYLHKVYEFGYNQGSNTWLSFHEMIHCLEIVNNKIAVRDQITINYRDKAGPLEKKFDRKYLNYATQTITKGMCYLQWSELGKIPYQYWIDNEKEDIQRLCQLAKPWLTLRPSFTIALTDIDLKISPEQEKRFIDWFDQYKQQWMDHWKLKAYSLIEMSSVIPIGMIIDIDEFTNRIKRNIFPKKIILA